MTFPVAQLVVAAVDPSELPKTLDPNSKNSLSGAVPIFLAMGAIVLLVVLWAIFIRRSPKYDRRGVLLESPVAPSSGRKRRRRARREHRSRNPTRAETGGLPPPGTGGSAPPPL